MIHTADTLGYYSITISPDEGGTLLRSNNERAFIISQLQDLLSPRLLLPELPAHQQLASCVDLLAFSLTSLKIDLVAFTIDKALLKNFIDVIISRLLEFRDDYGLPISRTVPSICIAIKKLAGPHHALERTVEIHFQHVDWEYDRYSSIGFYLHDRRGDWMRTWRFANLYDGDANRYREYLTYSQSGRLEQLPNLQALSP